MQRDAPHEPRLDVKVCDEVVCAILHPDAPEAVVSATRARRQRDVADLWKWDYGCVCKQ